MASNDGGFVIPHLPKIRLATAKFLVEAEALTCAQSSQFQDFLVHDMLHDGCKVGLFGLGSCKTLQMQAPSGGQRCPGENGDTELLEMRHVRYIMRC